MFLGILSVQRLLTYSPMDVSTYKINHLLAVVCLSPPLLFGLTSKLFQRKNQDALHILDEIIKTSND